jgi:two-component system LytT family response regulator
MARIRLLIALREPLIRHRVRDLLRDESDFEIVAESGDGDEVLDEIRRSGAEALLLDTAMPGLNGFDIVRSFDTERAPGVVFFGAGADQAQQAFDVGAVDFLLKPIDRRRLARALDRLRTWIRWQKAAAVGERLSALLQSLRAAAEYPPFLPVPSGGRIVFLSIDEIDWIEGSGNYVQVHSSERVFRLRQTLASLQASLDPGRFRRIHRRTIVNLSRIREVEPLAGGGAMVRLRDGMALRMSRGYRDLVSWLGGEGSAALSSAPLEPASPQDESLDVDSLVAPVDSGRTR